MNFATLKINVFFPTILIITISFIMSIICFGINHYIEKTYNNNYIRTIYIVDVNSENIEPLQYNNSIEKISVISTSNNISTYEIILKNYEETEKLYNELLENNEVTCYKKQISGNDQAINPLIMFYRINRMVHIIFLVISLFILFFLSIKECTIERTSFMYLKMLSYSDKSILRLRLFIVAIYLLASLLLLFILGIILLLFSKNNDYIFLCSLATIIPFSFCYSIYCCGFKKENCNLE